MVIGFVCLLYCGFCAGTANAESLEETYDATLAAYNRTLNQLEQCDLNFTEFQQSFKRNRPPADASKEEWDQWARAYRHWVDVMTGCMRNLKKEADALKKKLDELAKQLGSLANTETKAPPRKESDDEKKKKAQDLLKKGTADIEKWTLNVKYEIRQIDGWSGEASEQVKEHGSGKVRIEPRFVFKF